MLIIGLGKKRRSGKDTLAAFLRDVRGKDSPRNLDIQCFGFGDAVKTEVNEDFKDYLDANNTRQDLERAQNGEPEQWQVFLTGEWTHWLASHFLNVEVADVLWDDPKSPLGKCRQALQFWGTEYRRAQDPDYWLTALHATLDKANPQIALITDLRFPNEHQYIKTVGGVCIELINASPRAPAPSGHSSENQTFACDFKIVAPSVTSLQLQGLVLFDQITAGIVSPAVE